MLARDYLHRMDEYLRVIVDGFEQLPAALAAMLRGHDVGKMIVRVAA